MPIRSQHVNILHPDCPPSGVVHVEIEMADFIASPVVESEGHRLWISLGVVNPHYHSGTVDFHGCFNV